MTDDRRTRATINDVATLAGVSPATVSRALRNAANVSPSTKERVRDAADQLNFSLSKSASALASGRAMRILLLVSGTLNGWFNANVLQGVYETLTPQGYDVIPSFITNRAQLDRYFQELPKNRNADAIIVSSFEFSEALHDQLHAMHMPVVGLDAPATTGFDASVNVDDTDGMTQALHLLQSLGHERCVFVGGEAPADMVYSTTARVHAFRDAATKLRIPSHTLTARGDTTALLARQLAAQLLSLSPRPTGVCAETDELAVALVKELRRQHLRVPDDCSIIGFDDADIAHIADLTTIRQEPLTLGRTAAALTLALLESRDVDAPHQLMPTRLILRDTTAMFDAKPALGTKQNPDSV